MVCCGCCYRRYIDIILYNTIYNPYMYNTIYNYIILLWYNRLYGFIQGLSFQSFIYELVALIHFMMNSFSLVHVFIYGFMVAVIVGYDWNVPYILLWCYPYVIPTIARCYNPQVVFFLLLVLLVGYRVDLCVCVGWPTL